MHVKPAPSQDIRRIDLTLPPSIGLHAVRLIEQVSEVDQGQLIYFSEGENRAEQMAQALKGPAPDLDVCLLPPWDCLPYDNTSPSREAMGRRKFCLRERTMARCQNASTEWSIGCRSIKNLSKRFSITCRVFPS